jgi:hypothetical protein
MQPSEHLQQGDATGIGEMETRKMTSLVTMCSCEQRKERKRRRNEEMQIEETKKERKNYRNKG